MNHLRSFKEGSKIYQHKKKACSQESRVLRGRYKNLQRKCLWKCVRKCLRGAVRTHPEALPQERDDPPPNWRTGHPPLPSEICMAPLPLPGTICSPPRADLMILLPMISMQFPPPPPPPPWPPPPPHCSLSLLLAPGDDGNCKEMLPAPQPSPLLSTMHVFSEGSMRTYTGLLGAAAGHGPRGVLLLPELRFELPHGLSRRDLGGVACALHCSHRALQN